MSKEAELLALKAKVKARTGKPGYATNCEALKAAIARLEAEIG